jgi:hypothetical protein
MKLALKDAKLQLASLYMRSSFTTVCAHAASNRVLNCGAVSSIATLRMADTSVSEQTQSTQGRGRGRERGTNHGGSRASSGRKPKDTLPAELQSVTKDLVITPTEFAALNSFADEPNFARLLLDLKLVSSATHKSIVEKGSSVKGRWNLIIHYVASPAFRPWFSLIVKHARCSEDFRLLDLLSDLSECKCALAAAQSDNAHLRQQLASHQHLAPPSTAAPSSGAFAALYPTGFPPSVSTTSDGPSSDVAARGRGAALASPSAAQRTNDSALREEHAQPSGSTHPLSTDQQQQQHPHIIHRGPPIPLSSDSEDDAATTADTARSLEEAFTRDDVIGQSAASTSDGVSHSHFREALYQCTGHKRALVEAKRALESVSSKLQLAQHILEQRR